MPRLAVALRLAGCSFLVLFLELALIRYVPGYVRMFAFYLNCVLIAAFLGMGVGMIRADSATRLPWLAVPALLLLLGAVRHLSREVVHTAIDPDKLLWGYMLPSAEPRVGSHSCRSDHPVKKGHVAQCLC
ncbi:MAG: hypothetical protein ACREMM_05540 [Gemmatimonadales bacterium]